MMLGGLSDGCRASSGSTTAFRFHAFFAASFGGSGNYLQALLVQDQERRNAENLSESVGISARAMQRFLTEARWSDETVIGRLQEYLAPRLGHPGVGVRWQRLPQAGPKSAGVARQYCGRLGKVANCQGGMFLAYVSPLGRALVDKRLYLPKSWTSDQDRCAAAGVPEDRRNYRSKTELALEMLERVLELGYLRAEWVAETTPSRPSGRDWRPWGCATVRNILQAAAWAAAAMEQRGDELPLAGDNGGPGKRRAPTGSVPSGCGPPGGASPARNCGPSGAGTCEPRYYPTLPRAQPWRLWPRWVGPGGALKRSSRLRRVTWGWTNTRPAAGQGGITT